MRLLLTSIAAFAVSACAVGTEPIAPQTVGPDYALGGGRFHPTGTPLIVAADAFEQDGRVAVCAAWAADGATARDKVHFNRVLETGVLQLGGGNVLHGFAGFPRAASQADLVGAPAECVLTGRPWRAEYAGLEPEIAFGRLQLEIEDEPLGGVSLAFHGD